MGSDCIGGTSGKGARVRAKVATIYQRASVHCWVCSGYGHYG